MKYLDLYSGKNMLNANLSSAKLAQRVVMVNKGTQHDGEDALPKIYFLLTLVLWSRICPAFVNSVDQDHLASWEAKWSWSALFFIQYVDLYQQPGSSNLIGWQIEVGGASKFYSACQRLTRMTATSEKVPSDVQVFRSVWSESSLGTLWIAKDANVVPADNEDRSDGTDALTDLSLCWTHMSESTCLTLWLIFLALFLVLIIPSLGLISVKIDWLSVCVFWFQAKKRACNCMSNHLFSHTSTGSKLKGYLQ